jgi:hypothetical protein
MAIKDDMEDVQEAVINELITENGITNTLADGQVTETKILNSAVTTPKIADGAVTAAKLGSDVNLTPADGSITPAKLDRAYLESTGGTVTIDSSGRLLLGTTTEGQSTADNLTIADSGHCGITLRSGSSSVGSLFFSDTTSGTGEYIGYVQYDHGGNYMKFQTNGAERMRIQADGTIKISNSSAPSTPSGGGVIYVHNGALYFRGSSGTITQLASA